MGVGRGQHVRNPPQCFAKSYSAVLSVSTVISCARTSATNPCAVGRMRCAMSTVTTNYAHTGTSSPSASGKSWKHG